MGNQFQVATVVCNIIKRNLCYWNSRWWCVGIAKVVEIQMITLPRVPQLGYSKDTDHLVLWTSYLGRLILKWHLSMEILARTCTQALAFYQAFWNLPKTFRMWKISHPMLKFLKRTERLHLVDSSFISMSIKANGARHQQGWHFSRTLRQHFYHHYSIHSLARKFISCILLIRPLRLNHNGLNMVLKTLAMSLLSNIH